MQLPRAPQYTNKLYILLYYNNSTMHTIFFFRFIIFTQSDEFKIKYFIEKKQEVLVNILRKRKKKYDNLERIEQEFLNLLWPGSLAHIIHVE